MSYLSMLKALKGVCGVVAMVGLMFMCSAEASTTMPLAQFFAVWGGILLVTFLALFFLNKLEQAEKQEVEYQKHATRRYRK